MNLNEQKNSLEGAGSTTPDIDTFTKKKQTIENFLSSYGKLISKVENLMKKEKFKKLEEIVKKYFKKLIFFLIFLIFLEE